MKERVIPIPFRRAAAPNMPLLEDKDAFDGLKKLDQRIIGAIYDRYFPEVYRYILYRVSDESVAEDIASDVFLRLLEASRGGRPPGTNLKGWLIGTASHAVMDHMRHKYRRPQESISDSLVDLALSPVSEVDQRERNRAVKDAYARLTPDQQDVLALRFGQGYSLEETAALLKKNVNAVKALQFRALASLQREISEVNDE